MTSSCPSPEALLSEIASLKLRLEEAEDTLGAIRSGGVDALVHSGQVYTLEGAERHYHELVDHMSEGAAFLNQDGIIFYANRYLADLLDTPLSTLTQSRWLDHVAAADQNQVSAWLAQPGSTQSPREISLVTPRGEPRPVLLNLAALNLSGQPGFAIIVTDIRERKVSEAKITRLNRLYAMASAVNAVIARQPARTELFHEFCHIAVDLGGYRLAWIGKRDPANGAVSIVAAAGATGYLEALEHSKPDTMAELEPSAFGEGRCRVFNDFQQMEPPRPWVEKACAFGLRAAASVPFSEEGATCGAFTVYGTETGCFGDEEQALLRQMGSDLSFAINQAIQAERLREAERQVAIATEREQAAAALRELTRILTDSQRVAKIGSWALDWEGHMSWSAETYHLVGVSPDAFTPSEDALLTLMHPEDRAPLQQWFSQCRAGLDPAPLTLRCYLPDGSLRYLRNQGERQHESDGRPLRLLGTVQDVTDQVTANRAMDGLRQLMAEGERMAHVGSWEYHAATQETVWSAEECRIYGVDPAEPSPDYPTLLRQCVHPDDVERLHRTFQAALQAGVPYANEHRVVHPDGTVREVRDLAHPHFDAAGHLIKYVGTTLDITEQRQAEAALRRAEERLRLATEGANLGIWYWDMPHNTVEWSDRCKTLLALPPGQSPSLERFYAALHPEDRDWVAHLVQQSLDIHEDFTAEYRVLGLDGSPRWIRALGRPYYGEAGQPIGMGGVLMDITASRQALDNLRDSEQRFRSLFEHLPMAYQSLDREGCWLDANPKMAEMLGFEHPEELLGKPFRDFLEASEVAPFENCYQCFLQTQAMETELRLRRRDGHPLVARVIGRVQLDLKGVFQRTHCILVDMTERKDLEDQIRTLNADLERRVEQRTQELVKANAAKSVKRL